MRSTARPRMARFGDAHRRLRPIIAYAGPSVLCVGVGRHSDTFTCRKSDLNVHTRPNCVRDSGGDAVPDAEHAIEATRLGSDESRRRLPGPDLSADWAHQ